MATSRRRRPSGSPVPPLHLVLIISTVVLIVLSGAAYLFAPESKAPLFSGIALGMMGFLSGKLSNGFGKPLIPPSPETPEEQDADGDDTEGQ